MDNLGVHFNFVNLTRYARYYYDRNHLFPACSVGKGKIDFLTASNFRLALILILCFALLLRL